MRTVEHSYVLTPIKYAGSSLLTPSKDSVDFRYVVLYCPSLFTLLYRLGKERFSLPDTKKKLPND
ncbi:hypothetical protein AMI01nite_26390 [Aneurinibacillus migulanus]|nr:hypothetical protein AMI01nite_26390 [Aneurinibacillus migulanus]